jgi:hypothetical protein
MQQRDFAYLPEVCSWPAYNVKIDTLQPTSNLSPEEIEQAIIRAWEHLQDVPSYVEERMKAHRGLIEGIATLK